MKGAYLSDYSGVIQFDSIDPEKAIIKQSSDNVFAPAVKTIPEITLEDEGKLVKIENVQFQYTELSNTFADAVNQSSENRLIEDCDGNVMIAHQRLCKFCRNNTSNRKWFTGVYCKSV
ncbi:MAG: hypothetical protein IPM77_16470 [Crocinitomicaceae bacterium]|nr:hypothetical protein [Crocinitomicaceae bacterium]